MAGDVAQAGELGTAAKTGIDQAARLQRGETLFVQGGALALVVGRVRAAAAAALVPKEAEKLKVPVSYTHLDVYKRQELEKARKNAEKWKIEPTTEGIEAAAKERCV